MSHKGKFPVANKGSTGFTPTIPVTRSVALKRKERTGDVDTESAGVADPLAVDMTNINNDMRAMANDIRSIKDTLGTIQLQLNALESRTDGNSSEITAMKETLKTVGNKVNVVSQGLIVKASSITPRDGGSVWAGHHV